MRRSFSLVLAAVVAAVAMVAPAALSVYLASRQSVKDETLRVTGYAQDVLRRGEETGTQIRNVVDTLRKANYPPCSPREVDLMRQLDLGSSYVQAVGRINGDNLICTSLGTQQPIPVGPQDAVSALGLVDRLNRRLSGVSSDKLDIFSEGHYAVIVDQALLFDTPNEGGDVEMALFMPSSHGRVVVASTAKSPVEFLTPIGVGEQASYVKHGRIVSAIRSNRYDLQVVATVPRGYANRRLMQLALTRVPLGILCGLLLTGAVVYLSRIYLSLPMLLRGAARRREFFVEYQPVVELATGRWCGAEALVRWKRNGVVVSPDRFIPAAEEQGVITAITAVVMETVARDLRGLVALEPEFEVGINLAAADMCSEETLQRLDRMLEVSGVSPTNIYVEATERGFLQGEKSTKVLNEIRARGFQVAIDDFGTGYSSLSALQSLSLDALKIDKTFVETIGTDGATSGVVLHIIEMAKSMGLVMVAEGVETEAQAEFLRARGVQYAQGWLFSRPLGVEELKRRMRAAGGLRG
jgi:sensor c-di-GMP phosphodiesterase-like protein